SSAGEPLAIVMISIAILFIGVIALLGKVVIASYEIHRSREKKKRILATTTVTTALLFIATSAMAQDADVAQAAGSTIIGGLSQTSFYFLLSVIILELI